MSYRKIGGLHFLTLGRLGLSWYWRRKKVKVDLSKLDDASLNLVMEEGLRVMVRQGIKEDRACMQTHTD